MARLPSDAGDTNVWGQLLNEFLLVSHNPDGTVKVLPANLGIAMANGEIPYDRRFLEAHPAGTSGDVYLTYFVASKTETVTSVAMYSAGTAALSVTLARIGVYSVAPNGDLGLLAACANDTAMFTGTNTRYQKTLTSSWSKVAGTTYAVGCIVVASTMPTLYGSTSGGAPLDAIFAREPRLSGARLAQADLPASITSANIVANRRSPYFEALT